MQPHREQMGLALFHDLKDLANSCKREAQSKGLANRIYIEADESAIAYDALGESRKRRKSLLIPGLKQFGAHWLGSHYCRKSRAWLPTKKKRFRRE